MTQLDIQPPSMKTFLTQELFCWIDIVKFGPFMMTQTLQKGDGHRVLVLPGFLTSDASTIFLRYFLRKQRYRPCKWQYGMNLGPSDHLELHLTDLVESLYKRDGGRKITVIGWSLGGIYAREIAREAPEMVRQVITLASPFATLKANNAYKIYEAIHGHSVELPLQSRAEIIRTPPPVPTTAIYSKNDGVVAWQSCLEQEGPMVENIEVDCAHCGMGINPYTLMVINDRLLMPEDHWVPFHNKKHHF